MKRRGILTGVAVTGAAGIAVISAVTQSTQALAQAAASPAPGGTLDRIIKEKSSGLPRKSPRHRSAS